MNWRPEGWEPGEVVKKLGEKKKELGITTFYYSEAVEAGADAMLGAIREEIEKALLTEKECMELSGDNTPLSSDEWEKVSIWARGLAAKAQLQKILALLGKEV